ncbi:SAM-dependent methyltransferase [Kineosporia babensis]|uniref:Class I SAM-dependent methyltransferase n=1 Tax=Kineosporia babensis TaxID=499548 RepID=A0A9X1NIM3_9ACTN|nr:class I SAM-dependent methyltransferase [Kineosporia babensis]MCD5314750.1 class I SAM-dependent methyltransferase [Kineosporia babensis]
MDRQQVSRIAHTRHPIAAPLSDQAVTDVLNRALEHRTQLLDLGCGSAEWLLRALELQPEAQAVGIDVSEPALAHARTEAQRRGMSDRLQIRAEDAAGLAPEARFDVVFVVGSSHAFGGLLPSLQAARRHLAPGGVVVIGDGYWENPPSEQALEIIGPMDDLAGLVASVTEDGWTPVHGHTSTRAELDAYEWAWTGTLAAWGLEQAGTPAGEQALAVAREHREGWLGGYRDSFGFVTLILSPAG